MNFDKVSDFCLTNFRARVFGKVVLIKGSCLDVVFDLSERFGQFVGCWINDPPYGTTLNAWDKVIPADSYWDMAEAITRPTAPLVVFGSQPFTSAMIMSAENWHRYCLVWDKNKCGSPGLAKHRPMKVHEDIIVFSRKPHKYYPQMEVGDPYERAAVGRKGPNNHKYGFSGHTGIKNTGTRYPKSILRFPRNFSAQQQVHPTQKPTTLLEWLVRSYSVCSDVVLDVTAGSFSTAIAAYVSGRACIAIEQESKYFKLGCAWLNALHRRKPWCPASYRKTYLET